METAHEQPATTVTELGAPIGLGRTAEVYAWGDNGVLKLLRPGFPDLLGELEANVAALVSRASVGAPRFIGTVRLEGRFGLIYERLAGPSMLDGLSARPWQIDRLTRRFAELHAVMHEAAGSGLPDQKANLRRMIDRADEALSEADRRAALAHLDTLPDGDAICHGDMHPGNVLVTARGAIVIDWLTASSGSPAGDVARTLFLLCESGIPEYTPRLQRAFISIARRRFSSVYLRHYRRLRRLDQSELAAWRLPILAARLGEEIGAERPAVEALIRGELERA